jgi:hypothetical protein
MVIVWLHLFKGGLKRLKELATNNKYSMLTFEDQKHILSEFPDLKLSYENITHKKVYNSELVVAIPEGAKCFAWFTYFKEAPVCLLFELGPDKRPCLNIRLVYCCFKGELAYGTVVYGTMISNNQFFAVEDIFLYKGTDVSRKNWGDKMVLFHSLLTNDMHQIAYNKSFIVFGLPPFAKTFDEVISQIKAIRGYRFASIQYRLLGRSNNYLVSILSTFEKSGAKSTFENPPLDKVEPKSEATRSEATRSEATRSEATRSEAIQSTFRKGGFLAVASQKPLGNIDKFGSTSLAPPLKKVDKVERVKNGTFTVKPDLQNDIYHLYEDGDKYHSVALIPDYKTSVMMNKLFRNIKENTNLDALEESDDEDEFEDDRDDRFVFLDKSYKMVCAYNNKFKKWVPVRLF